MKTENNAKMSLASRIAANIAYCYLRFVEKTSRIIITGPIDLIYNGNETFVMCFWHGDSFCYFPVLKYRGDFIISTKHKRGDVICAYAAKYGYISYRMPDDSAPESTLPDIRHMAASAVNKHICLTMDGPLGPYHTPQRFFYTIARLTKKRLLPVSLEIRGCIKLKKRWDKYKIPLPFSRMHFHIFEPIPARRDDFDNISARLVSLMG